MEAKFFGQVLKIPAGGITYVCPNDVALYLAQLADVGCDAVLRELLSVRIKANGCDHSGQSPLRLQIIGTNGLKSLSYTVLSVCRKITARNDYLFVSQVWAGCG